MTHLESFNIVLLADDRVSRLKLQKALSHVSSRINIHSFSKPPKGIIGKLNFEPHLFVTNFPEKMFEPLLSSRTTVVIISNLESLRHRFFGEGKVIVLDPIKAPRILESMLRNVLGEPLSHDEKPGKIYGNQTYL